MNVCFRTELHILGLHILSAVNADIFDYK